MRKIKHMLSIGLSILILLSVITVLPVSAVEYNSDGFRFEKITGGASILGYSNNSTLIESTTLKVPLNLSGNVVLAIGSNAFKDNEYIEEIVFDPSHILLTAINSHAFYGVQYLQEVTIPKGVTTLGPAAFYGCSSLTSLTFAGNGLDTIQRFAFAHCPLLDNVVIPGSVTTIEEYAFANNTALTTVFIPKFVTSIASNAFENCPDLVIYGISGSEAENYASKNGITFVAQNLVTKNNLLAEINKAKAVIDQSSDIYTQESINELSAQLKNALAAYEEKYISQASIDIAVNDLKAAYNALLYRMDKTILNQYINTAELLLENELIYTSQSVSHLKACLLDARAVAANENIQQDSINTAAASLKTAIEALTPKPDKTSLEALMLTAKDILDNKANLYVSSSISDLSLSYTSAEAVYNNSEATDEEITQAVNLLNESIVNLTLRGDKTELNTLLSSMKTILDNNQDEYTTESFEALQQAYTAAKTVSENIDATSEDVLAVVAPLNQAITGLVKRGDKAELNTLLSQAKNILDNDQAKYTTASYGALQQAYTAAKTVSENIDAIDEDILAVVTPLNQAITGLVSRGDKTELNTLLSHAKIILETDKDQYTSGSIETLQQAYTPAKAVSENTDATDEDILAATTALNQAMSGLVKRGDKAELNTLLSNAKNILDNNQDKYTKESIAALQQAYTAAKAVSEDIDVTDEDILAVVAPLSQAINELTELADKTGLDELIATVKDILDADQDKYTTESLDALQQAYTTAKKVSEDSNATKDDISSALKSLQKAKSDLEEKSKNILLGDVDGNGEIEIDDALLVHKHAAMLITLADDQFIAADVDKNQEVDIADALIIRKHIAKLILEF